MFLIDSAGYICITTIQQSLAFKILSFTAQQRGSITPKGGVQSKKKNAENSSLGVGDPQPANAEKYYLFCRTK